MEQFIVKITTMTDGDRTVAEALITTAYPHEFLAAGTGSSGREPGDKSDAQTGKDLAIARSLRSVAAHLERRAMGRVRHAESVKAHKAEIAERKAAEAAVPLVTLESLVSNLGRVTSDYWAAKLPHPPYENDEADVSGQGGALKPGGKA